MTGYAKGVRFHFMIDTFQPQYSMRGSENEAESSKLTETFKATNFPSTKNAMQLPTILSPI